MIPSALTEKYLKVKAGQEHTIKAVIKAGGSRSEVHLPPDPVGMADALAVVDTRLQAFIQQLDKIKTKQVRPSTSSVQIAKMHKTVLLAIEAWRSAWSNRDVAAYFSAYADDFDVTGRFASIHAWKIYKRWVIGKRSSIQVSLELIKLHPVSGDQIRVEFLQHFRADAYQSDDLKVLTFRRSESGWKIIYEESV